MRTLWRKIKNHFTLLQLDRLIDAENNFSQQLFRAKRDYEHNLLSKYACSRDPGIYQYIHSLTNLRSLPLVLYNESTVVTTDMDKANAFNQYFYAICKHDTLTILDNEDMPSTHGCISSIDISIEEVFDTLTNLDPSKASDLDNIGPGILKNSASILSKPLHYLFSLSLTSGKIPTEKKIHTIVPVFKSGDKTSIKNYRPVSLLNYVSKVLKQLVYNK